MNGIPLNGRKITPYNALANNKHYKRGWTFETGDFVIGFDSCGGGDFSCYGFIHSVYDSHGGSENSIGDALNYLLHYTKMFENIGKIPLKCKIIVVKKKKL